MQTTQVDYPHASRFKSPSFRTGGLTQEELALIVEPVTKAHRFAMSLADGVNHRRSQCTNSMSR
jgi:hypothetical protein